MARLAVLPATVLALALAAVACSDPPDDEAEVQVVAGARDEQPSGGTTPNAVDGDPEEPPPDDTNGGPQALLPDLVPRQPRDLWIQAGVDGVREIRFATTVANLGDGPLEMLGEYEEDTGQTLASQRILHVDGSTTEREVGRFLYHPGHDHWHFEDFTVFELWSVDENNDVEDLVATTGKLTFCLVDSNPVDDPPPGGVAMASILECNSGTQGLSSGWEETYEADFPGQELDIPEITDGLYAIRTIVDPDKRVRESDDSNNESLALVQITGYEIVVLQEL